MIGNISTGLGNPDRVLLNNKGKVLKRHELMFEDAKKTWRFFDFLGGADFQFADDGFSFGYEPAYQYERLMIIHINKDQGKSYIINGKAFDSYGSGIRKSIRFYSDYKYNSKFKRFIDKWHWVVR